MDADSVSRIDSSPQHTLLLVDDEENILASLRRLLRKDGYRILTASSGPAALDLLAQEAEVDIIMSDQRMPHMSGTEFLKQAQLLSPYSIRIILSGYTDLASVTAAINEGAVYKFLTKPWDDEILRMSLKEAQRHKWVADENRLLQSMQTEISAEFASRIEALMHQLEARQALLQQLPLPLFVISPGGDLIEASDAALRLLALSSGQLPMPLPAGLPASPAAAGPIELAGQRWRCHQAQLSAGMAGHLLLLSPEQAG